MCIETNITFYIYENRKENLYMCVRLLMLFTLYMLNEPTFIGEKEK